MSTLRLSGSRRLGLQRLCSGRATAGQGLAGGRRSRGHRDRCDLDHRAFGEGVGGSDVQAGFSFHPLAAGERPVQHGRRPRDGVRGGAGPSGRGAAGESACPHGLGRRHEGVHGPPGRDRTDETGGRVADRLHWIRVAHTGTWTLLHLDGRPNWSPGMPPGPDRVPPAWRCTTGWSPTGITGGPDRGWGTPTTRGSWPGSPRSPAKRGRCALGPTGSLLARLETHRADVLWFADRLRRPVRQQPSRT